MGTFTDTTAEVTFTNPFSDLYGKVERFSVIVSTSSDEVTADDVATWAEAKEQVGGVRTYIAIWECEDFFSKGNGCNRWSWTSRRRRQTGEEVTVTIGGETCDKVNRATYCNGPLEAETMYYFSLRGYTENGLHAETPSSSPIVTAGITSCYYTLTLLSYCLFGFRFVCTSHCVDALKRDSMLKCQHC